MNKFIHPLLAVATVAAIALPAAADQLSLNVTIRDFRRGDLPGGHPDFQYVIANDLNMVGTSLGFDGTPTYMGAPTTPTTNGAAAFYDWFHDVPGTNINIPLTLTLDNGQVGPGGVYTYSNSSFFPIDGQGWGNEGLSHNYHFTLQTHTTFTYQAGQVFSFTGDDDLWVYINGARVIDLGGVHGAQNASVSLDTLGLIVGNTYDFDLFFAERHTTESNFVISTSIPIPAPGAATAVAMGGLMVSRRRRTA